MEVQKTGRGASYGSSYDRGELRREVKQNLLDVLEVTKKTPRDQPKILYLGNANPGLICDLLHRLHVMISCLMDTKVRRYDSVRYITLNIHLFLQRLKEVDKSMRKPSNQTPVWVSKFSYLSLLNLPGQITSLGHLESQLCAPHRNSAHGGT
jgi:hypothetical protein